VRIVQIVETLGVGGLEGMAVNLAEAHRKAGHFSAIYTIFEPGALEGQARAAGVPVIPFYKRKGFSAGALARLVRQLRADRAEVVHTHNSSIHHYGAVAGKLARAVVVNTRHGLALSSSSRRETYFRAVMPLTDAVVFVCDYERRYYAQKGIAPKGKSEVIRNGIPLEPFRWAPAAPGSRKPKIRFGTVGRLVTAKAHGDLLAAFDLLARDLPEAELHLWGYGELRKELEARIAGRPRIKFHGQAGNTVEALRTLDVFVLSSISEGLPLVILEAMAAGLPIVSTRVGGVAEVAPEGTVAWFAEPGKPESLARAMRRAAASDLAAVGHAAWEYASRHFGVETMQQQYQALFERLLER
jgi:glycosyltransferase involved in cell wall biosynthesis